jgi:hypothetical protein
MSNHEARKAALFARTTTATLINSARILEALGQTKSPEQRMTAAWISDELERRAGLITDAEETEFERVLDETDSYLTALITLRPQLANL